MLNLINSGGGDPLCTLQRAEGLYTVLKMHQKIPLQFREAQMQCEYSQKSLLLQFCGLLGELLESSQ